MGGEGRNSVHPGGGRKSEKRASIGAGMTQEQKEVEEAKKKAEGEKLAETMNVKIKREIPMVDTQYFATVMAIVVVCNVVCIGFETELPAQAEFFGAINNGFLLIYIIELLMRMLTYGLKALRDSYTVVDTILILLGVLERIVGSGGTARALPSFRLFRVKRLLGATRYFQHSKELRSISLASVRMFKSLMWVALLLFFLLWTLGTVAHMVIGKSAEWNLTMDPDRNFAPFESLDIDEYFGSVWKSFLTLLQVVTLSQWAPHIARPIVKVYPATFLFFIIFLFVSTYGILVGIVANLVQDAMTASAANYKAMREKEREDRMLAGMQVRDILQEVDSDGSGELSAEEIDYALRVTNLEDFLRGLGVPVFDAESLVRLLDYSGNGSVSYEEMVNGIVRMDDLITKRDYAMMGFWMKNLLMRTSHLEERLAKLCDQISFIRKRLGGSFGALNHLIATAKDSQMRQKAIHKLKTDGPSLPPALEKKVIVKPTLKRVSPRAVLQASLGRFLGAPPQEKKYNDTLDDDNLRRTALFHNTMGDAPPRVEVGKRRAKRAELAWADKYQVVLETQQGRLQGPENSRTTQLKTLMKPPKKAENWLGARTKGSPSHWKPPDER